MIIPAIFGITTVKRDCPERANLRIMRKETNLKQNDMTKNKLRKFSTSEICIKFMWKFGKRQKAAEKC